MFAFPPNRSTGKPLSCGFPQRRHEVGADEQPRTSRASVVRLWPGALPATSLPRHLFVIGRENSSEQESMQKFVGIDRMALCSSLGDCTNGTLIPLEVYFSCQYRYNHVNG